MAESLRQIKRRIKSVNNTKKITKAMEMVAASKLRKYQDMLGQTKSYGSELERMLKNLVARSSGFKHPFFNAREVKNTLAVLITSDSGLCGSYNYNLFQKTDTFMRKETGKHCFVSVGRQGLAFLNRRSLPVVSDFTVPRPAEIRHTVEAVINLVTNSFLEAKTDKITLIYTEFISMANYKPCTSQVLPLELPALQDNVSDTKWILEPSAEKILERMIPNYLKLKIEQAFKEALVSEQISRMMAMRQATDNATEMIDSLTLQRNKARQAAITKELIEVVSGSKALQVK